VFRYRKSNHIVLTFVLVFVLLVSLVQAVPLRVYLLAGQSNMVGAGESSALPPELQLPQSDVLAFVGGQVVYSYSWTWLNLQPNMGAGVGYIGPEVTFGHDLKAEHNGKIALIKYSVGGTALYYRWHARDGDLYIGLMDIITYALSHLDPAYEPEIAGMIWMQGESDTAYTHSVAMAYQQNLTSFIQCVREDLNEPNMPFVIGRIAMAYPWPYGNIVRQAQYNVSQTVPHTAMINTDDLTFNADKVHYDGAGQMVLGSRFADAMVPLLLPVTLVGPANGAAVDSGGAVFTCQNIINNDVVSYQLLFGSDPCHVDFIVSDTIRPPTDIITEFPLEETWWTIRARDSFGCFNSAEPRHVHAQNVRTLVENINTGAKYASIQHAIDNSSAGDQIVVNHAIYSQSLDFKAKNITVRSADPNDPAVVAATVIKGLNQAPAVTFSGTESDSSTLSGFTITDSNIGIYARYTSATVEKCNISANTDKGISCDHANLKICNCIITENGAEGIYLYRNSGLYVTNCTISANGAVGINSVETTWRFSIEVANCIIWDNLSPQIIDIRGTPLVTYSDIQGGWSGLGNINTDPCFADPCNGDYHLLSQAGRWNQNAASWIQDTVSSRCIDAGNPGSPLGDEPNEPNNIRVNMGAYGRTAYASKTPADWALLADLTNDGTVDFLDFIHWSGKWLTSGDELPADLNRNGIVDETDLDAFTRDWLKETIWR